MNEQNNRSPFQRGEMETAQPAVTLGVSPQPQINNTREVTPVNEINNVVNTNTNSTGNNNNLFVERSTPSLDETTRISVTPSEINVANPTPISETPASEPKKKGKGGLIALIIILLLVGVCAVLVFVFDVFGLKKNAETSKNENEKVEEVTNNTDETTASLEVKLLEDDEIEEFFEKKYQYFIFEDTDEKGQKAKIECLYEFNSDTQNQKLTFDIRVLLLNLDEEEVDTGGVTKSLYSISEEGEILPNEFYTTITLPYQLDFNNIEEIDLYSLSLPKEDLIKTGVKERYGDDYSKLRMY